MSKRKSTENGQQSLFKRPSLPESCHIDDAAGTCPLNITVETVETDGEIDDDPLILYLTESSNASSSAQTESIKNSFFHQSFKLQCLLLSLYLQKTHNPRVRHSRKERNIAHHGFGNIQT